MVMCWMAAKAPRPRKRISPMWLTSKRPTAMRTARCSAITPPPGPGYSTGISQPPKSTILAFRARWVALRAVFLSGAAMGAAESGWVGRVMGSSFRAVLVYPAYDRDWAPAGSNPGVLALGSREKLSKRENREGKVHESGSRCHHAGARRLCALPGMDHPHRAARSEEHTSELQS